MRFITENDQLKAANSAVTVDMEIASIESYIDDAEFNVVALIGEAAAGEVLLHQFALTIVRKVIVNLALAEYSGTGAIEISDAGLHVTKSDKRLPASDKKLITFRSDSRNRGWMAFEQLINVMEESTDAFPLWKTSQKRKDYFSTIFLNSSEFSSFGGIPISPGLFITLKPLIRRIQEDVLGKDYGELLIDDILGVKLQNNINSIQRKLERKLMQILAPLALAEAIPLKMVQVLDDGLYTASMLALSSGSDNVQQLSAAEASKLQILVIKLSSEGESKRVQTLKWLQENSTSFPLFTGQNTTVYPFEKLNDVDSNVYFL